ncbi:nicotinamide N-methyltransferase-like [Dendropsophus ebraccatus]|uniref:nicotinamide N-methyltransferase-like n=1 Tax=Dendropsophus ebraccatus TaxID=150705 RepID=UPI003831B180
MDCGSYKLYHVHGFDSRQMLEDYFSDTPDMIFAEDTLIRPIENLTKTFALGQIKGDVLIDLSVGPMVHHLYAACEFFKHIIVLKVSDRCILELKRWLDTRTRAFNWGHAIKLHAEIEGKSDQFKEGTSDKEGKVRSAVQHVVTCDLEKENMTDPIVLPPADCIISCWLLDNISKDQDDYIRYLRKISRLLKPGGHLLLYGCLHLTFYTVGKEKFKAFSYDEDFARKALVGEGFVIDSCKVKKSTAESDLTDYDLVIFIAAHKEK